MEPDPQTAIALRGAPAPKKRRSLGFIRAVLYLLKGRSKKSKSMQVEAVASSELLNKVVGTMRPLHLAQNCPVSPSDAPRVSLPALRLEGKFEEGAECPFPGAVSLKASSSCSSFQTVSEGNAIDQYESPLHLLEPENPTEEDQGTVEDGGDEMIDAKAEEFIARFYEQIKIQS